jgi:hypothetical protein
MFNFVLLEIELPGFVAGVGYGWCGLVVPPGNHSGTHGVFPNLLAKLKGQVREPLEGFQSCGGESSAIGRGGLGFWSGKILSDFVSIEAYTKR